MERVLIWLEIGKKAFAKGVSLPGIVRDACASHKKISRALGTVGPRYTLELVPHVPLRCSLTKGPPTIMFRRSHCLAQSTTTSIDNRLVSSKARTVPSAACPGQLSLERTQLWGPPTVGTVATSVAQRDMVGSSVLESCVKGSGKGINIGGTLKWQR